MQLQKGGKENAKERQAHKAKTKGKRFGGVLFGCEVLKIRRQKKIVRRNTLNQSKPPPAEATAMAATEEKKKKTLPNEMTVTNEMKNA